LLVVHRSLRLQQAHSVLHRHPRLRLRLRPIRKEQGRNVDNGRNGRCHSNRSRRHSLLRQLQLKQHLHKLRSFSRLQSLFNRRKPLRQFSRLRSRRNHRQPLNRLQWLWINHLQLNLQLHRLLSQLRSPQLSRLCNSLHQQLNRLNLRHHRQQWCQWYRRRRKVGGG
jgi:hypothetical protein